MTEENPFEAYNVQTELDEQSKKLLEDAKTLYSDFVTARMRAANLPGEKDQSPRGQALTKIDKVLENHTDNPDALFLRGVIMHGMGEFPDAEATLVKVSEQGIASFALHRLLAEIRLERRSLDQVEYHVNQMIEIDKTRPEIYEIAAELHRLKDNDLARLEALEKIRDIAPSDERFVTAQISTLVKMERVDDAIKTAEEACDTFPDSHEIRFSLANLYADSERVKDAIELYNKVLEINPDHNMARFELANLLDEIDKPAKALELYQDYMQVIEEDPDVYYNAAGVAERLGKLDLTIDYYLTFLRITSNSDDFNEVIEWINENADGIIDEVELRIRLAEVYIEQNDPETALREIKAARKLGQNNRRINFLEGLANQDLDNHEKAEQFFEQAMKYDDYAIIDGFTDDDILIAAGETYLELGKLDNAEETAQEILRGESVEDGYTLLGDIYLEKEELDEAYDCFVKALQADMFSFDGFFGLGEVFDAKGEYENASTAFRRCYEFNNTDEDVLYRLGMDCIRLGYNEWGQFYLKKCVELYPDSEYIDEIKEFIQE